MEVLKVLQFEQKLAAIMMTIEEQRDFSKNYNEMTIRDLAAIANFTDFNWESFLNGFFGAGTMEPAERVAIYAKEYYKLLPDVLRNTDYNVLHNYVVWISIKPLIYTLSTEFQKIRYDLVFKVNGVDLSCNERWRMCTEHARDSLPLIVGRLYVENYFNNGYRQ